MPGYLSRLALGIEPSVTAVTWPSAAAALVTHELPPRQFAFDGSAVVQYSTARDTAVARLLAWQSQERGTATALHDVRYGGFEPFWALVMGYMARRIGATSLPEQLAAGVYRHQYEMPARLQHEGWTLQDGWQVGEGLALGQRRVARGTLAAQFDTGAIAELQSGMIPTAVLTGGVNLPWQLATTWQGYHLAFPASVNATGTFTGLPTTRYPRVFWHHTVLRLGAYSSSTALGSGQVLRDCAALELTMDHGVMLTQTRQHGLALDEPAQVDLSTVAGRLRFPFRSTTPAALWSGQRTVTMYMMDVQATAGVNIPTTSTPYAWRLYLPALTFTSAPLPVDGPGLSALDLPFTCQVPSVAAAGMPPTVQPTPVIMELVTGSNDHPLL